MVKDQAVLVSPLMLKKAMETVWLIPPKSVIRTCLDGYFILYYSGEYLVRKWNRGTIVRPYTDTADTDIHYHAILKDITFAEIKYGDPGKQYALSFRLPNKHYLSSWSYILPTVIISKAR